MPDAERDALLARGWQRALDGAAAAATAQAAAPTRMTAAPQRQPIGLPPHAVSAAHTANLTANLTNNTIGQGTVGAGLIATATQPVNSSTNALCVRTHGSARTVQSRAASKITVLYTIKKRIYNRTASM